MVDFECASDAFTVVGEDSLSGGGVDLLEALVELGVSQVGECGAEDGVGGGAIKHALEEGFYVEVGFACHDGQNLACEKVGYGGLSGVEPICDGPGLSRFDDVDEVMRYGGELLWCWFCGARVEVTVDLHRVGVDDLCVEVRGDCNGEVRFAACCRAE